MSEGRIRQLGGGGMRTAERWRQTRRDARGGGQMESGQGMNKKKKVGGAETCGGEERRAERGWGNIYLSPDGSVLGVHLWRNEISG